MLFRARALLISIAAATLAACGGSSSPPPSSPSPGSGDAIQITGRERFGWMQASDDITPLHFAVYVDGARVDLPAAACHGSAPSFDCDSPLPPLGAGRHVLEVVSWTSLNGEIVESPKASPLVVQVTGSTAPDAIASIASTTHAQASESIKAAGDACGLAPLSFGRFLLWTSAGEMRMVDRSSLASRSLAWPQAEGWRLIGVGAHSRFAETGWIYAVLVNATENNLRLVRYRDVHDVLGEAVVLREISLSVTPARAKVSNRENDRVYVALLGDDADDRTKPRSDAFLIRLNPDGSIPDENPIGSIYMAVSGSALPLAVDWASDDEVPWFIESAGAREYVLRRRGAALSSQRFVAAAPPVAMQFTNSTESNRLVVVHADGSLTPLTRTPEGWTVGNTRNAAPAKTADALLFPDGDLITCGTDADARYVVRRGSVPE